MYQPLSKEDSLREIYRLEQNGISFDKALQNMALLHYWAEKNNVYAKRLLDDWRLKRQGFPVLR